MAFSWASSSGRAEAESFRATWAAPSVFLTPGSKPQGSHSCDFPAGSRAGAAVGVGSGAQTPRSVAAVLAGE